MSKNPKNETSAKQQAIADRAETAYQLIEAGVKHSAATSILQRRFGIGRSTAYNDVQYAQIKYEDFQRHSSEMPEPKGIDPEEVSALLAIALQNAFADNDIAAMVENHQRNGQDQKMVCSLPNNRFTAPTNPRLHPSQLRVVQTNYLPPNRSTP